MSPRHVYEEERIDGWKMGMYLKDSGKDNIWDDVFGKTSSEFADKYFGGSLINEIRRKTTNGYVYIIDLINRLISAYSNVDKSWKNIQAFGMIEIVRKVMKIGQRFGFKPRVLNELLKNSFINSGKSRANDVLIPLHSYCRIFSIAPNCWKKIKQNFCSFVGGNKLYGKIFSKLILITVQCMVDFVRMNCIFKVNTKQALVMRSVKPTLILINRLGDNLESTTTDATSTPDDTNLFENNLLNSEDCLCRNEHTESAFSIMLRRSPNHRILFDPDEVPPLPQDAINFLDIYITTITHRLRQFVTSGEFRHHVERTFQIGPHQKRKSGSKVHTCSKIHLNLVEIMKLVAERILNVDGFPLFSKQWEPFINKLTRTTSIYLLTSTDFEMALEYFNKTCQEKLLELLKNHPDTESLELRLRARLTRFVFWFCASVLRFSTKIHFRRDNSVCNVMYDRFFEREIVKEQKWKPHSQSAHNQTEKWKPHPQKVNNLKTEVSRPLEYIEVSDEELEAARSLRAPSTSSGPNSAMVNPEFSDFYRRVQNDEKLSDEWKEMVRTMVSANYQLLREYDRVEKRYDRLCGV